MPLTITLRRNKGFCIIAARMSDDQALVMPINGRPLKPSEFSLSHAGAKRREYHLAYYTVCVGQQQLALFCRQVVSAGLSALGPFDFWRRRYHVAPFMRSHQTLIEHRQTILDCFAGDTLFNCMCLVALYDVGGDLRDLFFPKEWNQRGAEDIFFCLLFRIFMILIHIFLINLTVRL